MSAARVRQEQVRSDEEPRRSSFIVFTDTTLIMKFPFVYYLRVMINGF